MSLKTADKKGGLVWPDSLATRMTLWYALSTFVIVLTASGFLYRALSNSLANEDDVLLSQNLQIFTALMKTHPGELEDLREFTGEKPKWYRTLSFWTRILDGHGRVLTETPGMSRSLPIHLFMGEFQNDRSSAVHSQEGLPFRVLTAQGVWPGSAPPERHHPDGHGHEFGRSDS